MGPTGLAQLSKHRNGERGNVSTAFKISSSIHETLSMIIMAIQSRTIAVDI